MLDGGRPAARRPRLEGPPRERGQDGRDHPHLPPRRECVHHLPGVLGPGGPSACSRTSHDGSGALPSATTPVRADRGPARAAGRSSSGGTPGAGLLQGAMFWPRERYEDMLPDHLSVLDSVPDCLDRDRLRALGARAHESEELAVIALAAIVVWGKGNGGLGPFHLHAMLTGRPDAAARIHATATDPARRRAGRCLPAPRWRLRSRAARDLVRDQVPRVLPACRPGAGRSHPRRPRPRVARRERAAGPHGRVLLGLDVRGVPRPDRRHGPRRWARSPRSSSTSSSKRCRAGRATSGSSCARCNGAGEDVMSLEDIFQPEALDEPGPISAR